MITKKLLSVVTLILSFYHQTVFVPPTCELPDNKIMQNTIKGNMFAITDKDTIIKADFNKFS